MSLARERKIGLKYSAIAHAVLLVFIILGLPTFFEMTKPPEQQAISVDILPISEISNVKNSAPKPQEKEKPKPVEEPPKETAEVKNPKPIPPTTKAEASTPKEAPSLEKTKPEEKKEDKQKKVEDDLEAVLKSVEQSAKNKTAEKSDKKREEKPAETASDNPSKSDNYNAELPLSMSEKDAIRSQFIKCWSVPAGAKDTANLVVTLRVQVAADGSVTDAKLAKNEGRYSSDSYFRAAADSAIRAVHKCSPLQHLPADKYSNWKDMELTFDPREMTF